jgi:hypothetical protein
MSVFSPSIVWVLEHGRIKYLFWVASYGNWCILSTTNSWANKIHEFGLKHTNSHSTPILVPEKQENTTTMRWGILCIYLQSLNGPHNSVNKKDRNRETNAWCRMLYFSYQHFRIFVKWPKFLPANAIKFPSCVKTTAWLHVRTIHVLSRR